MQRTVKYLSAVGAAMLLCFALTGCSDKKAELPPPVDPTPKVTIKVEPMPAESPEQTRVHKLDEFGREFETEIAYRDNSKGLEIWNPTTSALVEFKRWYPGSTTLQRHGKYTAGKLVWEEQYHSNGKVSQRRLWHKNGDREYLQFSSDGTSELGKVLIRKDGSGEWIQRNQDWRTGKVQGMRQRYTWEANGDLVREEYDYQNGTTLLNRAATKGDNLVVDIFRPDGTVEFRQYHKAPPAPPSNGGNNNAPPTGFRVRWSWILEKVEVFAADGKTLVKSFICTAQRFGSQPSEVHVPQANGGKIVVEIGYDDRGELKVKGEKVFDKDGKLVSEQKDQTSVKTDDLKADYRAVQPAYNVLRNVKNQLEGYFRQ